MLLNEGKNVPSASVRIVCRLECNSAISIPMVFTKTALTECSYLGKGAGKKAFIFKTTDLLSLSALNVHPVY